MNNPLTTIALLWLVWCSPRLVALLFGNWWRDRGAVMSALLFLDHACNVLTGGSSRHTVSARIGYHAHYSNARRGKWRRMERVVNWAFAPVESGHCKGACEAEMDRASTSAWRFENGTRTLLYILGLGCCLLAPVIRLVTLIAARGR